MKKLYKYLSIATMAMISVAAKAASYEYTLPENNTVLLSEKYHMRLFKAWDFIGLTMNGTPITPTTLTTGEADNSLPTCDKIYQPTPITNEGMQGWYIGIGNIEFSPSQGGLYCNKNGVRYVIITGMKEGQIVCIQNTAAKEILTEYIFSDETTYEEIKTHDFAVNCNRIQSPSDDGKMPKWVVSYLSNNGGEDVVEEITDAIHEEQAKLDSPETEGEGEGEGEETEATSNVDGYRYFRVIKDGPLYIALGKYSSITGLQIWNDANSDEKVSAPSFQLKGASDDSRDVAIICGESTFNENCHILYGFAEEDGYEGPDQELSEDYLLVTSNEDYNEDGKVTIEAVTVSATGVKSEVATFEVEVNMIQLNAPTLTLVGFNNEYRLYKLGWENNTKNNAEVAFEVSGDDGEVFWEEPKVGTIVNAKKNITVKVKSNGYQENSTTIDVEYPGIDISHKIATEGHDIDFTKPSDEVAELIRNGQTPEKCYIEAEDGTKTYYTYDEYLVSSSFDGTVDLTDAVVVYKESGWTYDSNDKRKRATLNVITETTGEGEEAVNTYKYTDGLSLILPKGVTVECGPIEKDGAGVSQILNYLGSFDLGLTFMKAPTFTFARSFAKPGEIVIFTIAVGGGSNYLTYDSDNKPLVKTLMYTVPTDELLTVKLPTPSSNFCHVLNIDVYTYENLPADQYDPTSVKETTIRNAEPVEIYSITGSKIDALQKGINIVKMSDGSVKKIMIK